MYKHMTSNELNNRIDNFMARKTKRLEELEADGIDIDDPGELKEFDTHGWFTQANHSAL